MRVWLLLLSIGVASCATPQPVYLNADGTRANPPPAPPAEAGPSAAETALATTAAVLTGVSQGLSAGPHRDKLAAWIHNNGFDIAKCFHSTSRPHAPPDSNGVAEVLEEYNPSSSTMKVRLYWSGMWPLGGEHYSDILVTADFNANPPLVTVAVIAEDANFGPSGSCHYLNGEPL